MTDLNVLYVHLNAYGPYVYEEIPAFAEISVKQTRKFHDGTIFFISDHKADWFDKYDIIWLDLKQPDWNYDLIWEWTHAIKPDEGVFWHMTMARMALIDLFVNQCSKFVEKGYLHSTHTLYLEYDNMIFYHTDVLKPYCTNKVRYTFVSDEEASPGIMIFPHTDISNKFFDDFVGECHNQKDGRITDMTVLRKLLAMGGTDQTLSLDTIPHGLSKEPMDFLFDGASYGQYFGGTNNGHSKGFVDMKHYVGNRISMRFIFPVIKNKKPMVLTKSTSTPIFNLHVHSKNLKDFEITV